MSTGSYFEIVQLANGDFALQPAGESSSEHLVKISFGADAKAFLADKDVDVAHAMIKAAIKVVGNMREEAKLKSSLETPSKTIH
ncbi:hypothetical protein [Hahella ganghwensis]|uniref:hypothetical protein n=1 Tax=Hahella ganghwensis TaxID=286420 RepID=UPI000368F1AA|nr:hypothetical protein [Hahella ganghwensis]